MYTLNKDHVDATELLQFYRRIHICLERQPHKVVEICATVKWTEKNKLLEIMGGHVPQCPVAGDANA